MDVRFGLVGRGNATASFCLFDKLYSCLTVAFSRFETLNAVGVCLAVIRFRGSVETMAGGRGQEQYNRDNKKKVRLSAWNDRAKIR